MKGYKIFEKAPKDKLRCRNYLFEEKSLNELNGDIELCKNGFHFCTELNDCFKYYTLSNAQQYVICEIEADGIITDVKSDCSKRACSKLKIIKKLTDLEIVKLISDYKKLEYIKNKKHVSKECLLYCVNNIDIDILNIYYSKKFTNDVVELLLPKLSIKHVNLNALIYVNNEKYCNIIKPLLRSHSCLPESVKKTLYDNIINGEDVISLFERYNDYNLIIDHINKLNEHEIDVILKLMKKHGQLDKIYNVLYPIIMLTRDIDNLLEIYKILEPVKDSFLDEFKLLMSKITENIKDSSVNLCEMDYHSIKEIAMNTTNSCANYHLLCNYHSNLTTEESLRCIEKLNEYHINGFLLKVAELDEYLIPKISILSDNLLKKLTKIPNYQILCKKLIEANSISKNFDYCQFLKLLPEYWPMVIDNLNNSQIISIINNHHLNLNEVETLLSKINYTQPFTVYTGTTIINYIDLLTDVSHLRIIISNNLSDLIHFLQQINVHFSTIFKNIALYYNWSGCEHILKDVIGYFKDEFKLQKIKEILFDHMPILYYIVFEEFAIEICEKIKCQSEALYFLDNIKDELEHNSVKIILKTKFDLN